MQVSKTKFLKKTTNFFVINNVINKSNPITLSTDEENLNNTNTFISNNRFQS